MSVEDTRNISFGLEFRLSNIDQKLDVRYIYHRRICITLRGIAIGSTAKFCANQRL